MANRLFDSWGKAAGKKNADRFRTGGLLPIEPLHIPSNGGLDRANTDGQSSEQKTNTALPVSPGTPPTDSMKQTLRLTIEPPQRHSRAPKPAPLLLNLSRRESDSLQNACLTPSSMIIHDADFTSVPNGLLAALSDLLHSPRSPRNKPLPGRPRSESAPPTPTSVAELPGSILLENEGFPVNTARELQAEDLNTPRPSQEGSVRTEHQGEAHRESARRSRSDTDTRLSVTASQPKTGLRRLSADQLGHRRSRSGSYESSGQRLSVTKLGSPMPSPKGLRTRTPKGSRSGSLATIDQTEALTLKTTTSADPTTELYEQINAQQQVISMLTAQCVTLRDSHETTISSLKDSYEVVSSLKDAHAKELASLKNYINILESRNLSTPSSELSIDRSPSSTRSLGLRSATPSVANLRNLEDLENQRRASETEKELKQLQTEIRYLRERDSDNDQVRRERDQLRDTLEKAQTRLRVLDAQYTSLKRSEKSLKNTAEELESRLELANSGKLDLMEENLVLKEEKRKLAEKEETLLADLEMFKQRPAEDVVEGLKQQLSEKEKMMSSLEEKLNGREAAKAALLENEDFEKRLKEVQALADERERTIERLTHEVMQARQDLDRTKARCENLADLNENLQLDNKAQKVMLVQAKMGSEQGDDLNKKIVAQMDTIRLLQEERDRTALVLHGEIRSKARSRMDKELGKSIESPGSSKSEIDRAIAEIQAKVSTLLSGTGVDYASDDPQVRIQQLEREIEYHVKDIVLYKLDVRGYKKDIKRYEHKIKKLQAAAAGIPAPPSNPSSEAPTPVNERPATGLGISSLDAMDAALMAPTSSHGHRMLTPSTSMSSLASAAQAQARRRDASADGRRPVSRRLAGKSSPSLETPVVATARSVSAAVQSPTGSSVKSPNLEIRNSHHPHPLQSSPMSPLFAKPSPFDPSVTSAPPQRAGTERSISESIISSYARKSPGSSNPSPHANTHPLTTPNLSDSLSTTNTPDSFLDASSRLTHRKSRNELLPSLKIHEAAEPSEPSVHIAMATAVSVTPGSGGTAEKPGGLSKGKLLMSKFSPLLATASPIWMEKGKVTKLEI